VSGLLGCLMVGLAGCGTGSEAAAPGPPAPAVAVAPPVGPASAVPLRVLQMNLCNSGIAGCYTGRSTAEAVGVIRSEVPDLVTLNEVCEDDVPVLERALADVVPGGTAVSAFQPHRDGRTGAPYRCRNGRLYGLGVVSRRPAVPGSDGDRGVYPAQDPDDPEQRAWLCLDVAATDEGATPAVTVCTTHLAYTKREVARAQCGHLFGTVVARLRAREGAAPVVVGGDLNLGSGADPDLKACLPAGSALVDDGEAQHVVGTPEFVVDGFRTIGMRETDHPGLLVTLTPG
jgi:endonuclease/exonuclease/phosphatase family metal-dependent hydrolase